MWGSLKAHPGVDVSCLIDVNGKNLQSLLVKNCDKQSISDLSSQMRGKIKPIKTDTNKNIKKQMRLLSLLPTFVVRFMLHLISFLSYNLGLDLKFVNVNKNHYGSAILTNVSMFDIENAFGANLDFMRHIIIVILCAPKERVVRGEEGGVEARRVMNVNMLVDHRVVTRGECMEMGRVMRQV